MYSSVIRTFTRVQRENYVDIFGEKKNTNRIFCTLRRRPSVLLGMLQLFSLLGTLPKFLFLHFILALKV